MKLAFLCISVKAGCRREISVSHFQEDFRNYEGNREIFVPPSVSFCSVSCKKVPLGVCGYKAAAITMQNSPCQRTIFVNSAQLRMHSI